MPLRAIEGYPRIVGWAVRCFTPGRYPTLRGGKVRLGPLELPIAWEGPRT
jgi:hypothetical protein